MTTALAANVKSLRARLKLNQQAFAERLGVQQSYVSKWESGTVTPSGDSIAAMAELAGCSFDAFKTEPLPPEAAALPPQPRNDDDVAMVGIQHIDMAYGLGTTFAVDHPEVDVLMFPKQWIETITFSSPALLTWTRGKGDSMEPTIRDGDLVLLDRSTRTLNERDALWAFTIGEEAAIKRLRRQGDRCLILSDNKNVPPDEQNLRDINIVGRVVFVGSRK